MKTYWPFMILCALMIAIGVAAAQQNPGTPPQTEGKGKVLDLVFRVEDMGGKVQSLEIKESATEVRIDLAADVLFDFDKYTLKPVAADALRKVAQVAASYPSSPLLIEGHTDGKGTHSHNMTLSENRAQSVKNWLAQNASIAPSRITTRGWGETKPVAPNKKPDGSDNPEARKNNRRVEVTIRKT